MSFFHKKPSKFCDALLFFVIGIVLLVTSSRITCFLGECILITSGSGFDAKGVRFSSGDVTLIQTVAIVMFIIAMSIIKITFTLLFVINVIIIIIFTVIICYDCYCHQHPVICCRR